MVFSEAKKCKVDIGTFLTVHTVQSKRCYPYDDLKLSLRTESFDDSLHTYVGIVSIYKAVWYICIRVSTVLDFPSISSWFH